MASLLDVSKEITIFTHARPRVVSTGNLHAKHAEAHPSYSADPPSFGHTS
jgi:hypothetical protein